MVINQKIPIFNTLQPQTGKSKGSNTQKEVVESEETAGKRWNQEYQKQQEECDQYAHPTNWDTCGSIGSTKRI